MGTYEIRNVSWEKSGKKSLKGAWDRGEEVEQGEGGAVVGESPDLGLKPEMLELSEVLEVGMRARIARAAHPPQPQLPGDAWKGFPAWLSSPNPTLLLSANKHFPAWKGSNPCWERGTTSNSILDVFVWL